MKNSKSISQNSIQAKKLLNTDKSKDVFSPKEILKETEKISSNIETKELNIEKTETIEKIFNSDLSDKEKIEKLYATMKKAGIRNVSNSIAEKRKFNPELVDYNAPKEKQKQQRDKIRKVVESFVLSFHQLKAIETNTKVKQTEKLKELHTLTFNYISLAYKPIIHRIDEIKSNPKVLYNWKNEIMLNQLKDLLNLKF